MEDMDKYVIIILDIVKNKFYDRVYVKPKNEPIKTLIRNGNTFTKGIVQPGTEYEYYTAETVGKAIEEGFINSENGFNNYSILAIYQTRSRIKLAKIVKNPYNQYESISFEWME
jgi:hypothetical protein